MRDEDMQVKREQREEERARVKRIGFQWTPSQEGSEQKREVNSNRNEEVTAPQDEDRIQLSVVVLSRP